MSYMTVTMWSNISSYQQVIYNQKFQKNHKKQVCLDGASNN